MSSSFPCNFKELREILKEYPKMDKLWNLKHDAPEESNKDLGGLQKNRILGIFLWFREGEKSLITTNEIKDNYEKFFKINGISRSNISTYLNQLCKNGVLKKHKAGKEVEYGIAQEPPVLYDQNPFWLIYNFCILPNYLCRMSYFANKLNIAKSRNTEEIQLMELILINLIKNRINKCCLCRYGDTDKHELINNEFNEFYKDRTKLFPKELKVYLDKLGEIEIFGGEKVGIVHWPKITGKIMYFANKHKEDIKNQDSLNKKLQKL